MKRTILTLALLCIATTARGDGDADAIAALRAKVEEQAAQIEALRASVARLEGMVIGQQPTPPLPPPVAAAPAPVVVATAAAAAPSYPTMRIAGLLQTWFVGGNEGFADTFRIRRAEMRMSGDLAKNVGWSVMIDPAKVLSVSSTGVVNQASRTLQDAFITVGGFHSATLVAGQYRIPLSREGLEPAGALDTVERALFLSDRARGGAYGDIRDIGVTLRGSLQKRFDYQFGIFNGSGESQNDTDRDDRKAVVGRFVAGVSEGLRVGLSGVWGGPDKTTRPQRDRLGGEILFTRGPLKLAGEYMTGQDGTLERRGFYAHAGYKFKPRWEGVVRIDSWDPDTSRDAGLASAEETDYIVGFNFSPVAKLRFQVNAVHKTFSDDALDSRDLLLANLQTSW